jgi:hypothetical protein
MFAGRGGRGEELGSIGVRSGDPQDRDVDRREVGPGPDLERAIDRTVGVDLFPEVPDDMAARPGDAAGA